MSSKWALSLMVLFLAAALLMAGNTGQPALGAQRAFLLGAVIMAVVFLVQSVRTYKKRAIHTD